MKLLDLKAFGFDLYFEFNPNQGWQRLSSEPVRGGKAYWFGPIHGAVCRVSQAPR